MCTPRPGVGFFIWVRCLIWTSPDPVLSFYLYTSIKSTLCTCTSSNRHDYTNTHTITHTRTLLCMHLVLTAGTGSSTLWGVHNACRVISCMYFELFWYTLKIFEVYCQFPSISFAVADSGFLSRKAPCSMLRHRHLAACSGPFSGRYQPAGSEQRRRKKARQTVTRVHGMQTQPSAISIKLQLAWTSTE